MVDSETIKALEKWCDNNCKKVCPHLKICDKCVVTYIKSVLNLINRQKAEIERQKEYCLKCAENGVRITIYFHRFIQLQQGAVVGFVIIKE